ncbi:MAG: aminopeptidase P family N-terminal domain-containing protein [Planctomycetales bacterium]
MPTADIARIEDLEAKHRRVIELMSEQGLDALLIQQPENFAWFTAGGDNTGRGGPDITAALFITPDARVIVGGNADIGQVFDTEILGLGFQLKERPWFEPKNVLLSDLCRGRRVGSDTPLPRTQDLSAELATLRFPLTPFECDRMRKIGRHLAHAVEATARNLQELQSEAEVAGEVSHRLLKH